MGADVVVVIADSAANNVAAAGERVELEFAGVYFVRCAAHGVDLTF